INHPVAKPPKQEQGGDQCKGDEKILPVGGPEKAAGRSRVFGFGGWCDHGLEGSRCGFGFSYRFQGRSRTVSFFGPCAPSTRMRSMSPVRLGPLIKERKLGNWPLNFSCAPRSAAPRSGTI